MVGRKAPPAAGQAMTRSWGLDAHIVDVNAQAQGRDVSELPRMYSDPYVVSSDGSGRKIS